MITFERLFGTRSGQGTALVVEHVRDIEDTDFIEESSVILSNDLLDAIAS